MSYENKLYIINKTFNKHECHLCDCHKLNIPNVFNIYYYICLHILNVYTLIFKIKYNKLDTPKSK